MAACGVTEVMEEFDSVDPETEALIAQLFSPARAFIQKVLPKFITLCLKSITISLKLITLSLELS